MGATIARDLSKDHALLLHWHTHPIDALEEQLPEAEYTQADLTKPEAAQQIIEAALDRFGRIDLIVNNAGATYGNDYENIDAGGMAHLFAINSTAPAQILAHALPHLKPGASVVNISSMNARLPAQAAPLYSASKAALNTWTKAAAKTLGPKGIRVNAVAPGAVNTDQAERPEGLTQLFLKDTALGKLATPQDIANAVRFLASDQAAAITGEVLTVSGGYRL
ncbi:MAG: SDR family oxidoreductase [Oceanicola sp.]|nr:SDR family oxidoreductase [Oceanicola sp.]